MNCCDHMTPEQLQTRFLACLGCLPFYLLCSDFPKKKKLLGVRSVWFVCLVCFVCNKHTLRQTKQTGQTNHTVCTSKLISFFESLNKVNKTANKPNKLKGLFAIVRSHMIKPIHRKCSDCASKTIKPKSEQCISFQAGLSALLCLVCLLCSQ